MDTYLAELLTMAIGFLVEVMDAHGTAENQLHNIIGNTLKPISWVLPAFQQVFFHPVKIQLDIFGWLLKYAEHTTT